MTEQTFKKKTEKNATPTNTLRFIIISYINFLYSYIILYYFLYKYQELSVILAYVQGTLKKNNFHPKTGKIQIYEILSDFQLYRIIIGLTNIFCFVM